jgi:OFA family oxalate/formate antiporter-like MFS transporter
MTDMAMRPYETFRLLGMAFLGLVCVAGMFMENPAGIHVAGEQRLPMGKVLSQRAFVSLYLAMMTGLAAGFAVNANIKELFAGASVEAGVGAVALFAMANAAGRIVWGWGFDRYRCIRVLQINLLLQAVVLLLSTIVLRSETGLAFFAILSGFNYGGILVLYASETAEQWGRERFSQVYGWLFSANIPAAVAPILAGMVFDYTGRFAPALWGIGGLMVGGALALGWGGKNKGK